MGTSWLRPRFGRVQVDQDTGLVVTAICDETGLSYTANMIPDSETGVITLTARLESHAPIRLDWFAAPVLPAPRDGHITDFSCSRQFVVIQSFRLEGQQPS